VERGVERCVTDLEVALRQRRRLQFKLLCRVFDVPRVVCYTDVRQQLSDQLKYLDVRLDSHVTMLGELQDFYRRRSEVEMEYSRGIDKLVKQIMTRHKTDKQKSACLSLSR